ncbi:hypothetical protein [Puniceicoccus vermicola]|uniref:Porin family protein n=1 Tax=Puniceicoccus vermicola TaxID=388746 RepID=A0A7X1AVX3_9BACT|nr:hypothetical protein [Puniceicoccus vermicola]MBC2600927.1 hypothetical protein [Puniceicoccus vermicola]
MKKVLLVLGFLSICLVPAKAQLLGLEAGAYGSYWKPKDLDEGHGGGIVARGQIFGFFGLDGRVGYFKFDDPSVDMVPMEVTAMLRFPFPLVSPFVGIGGGYYQFSGEKGFSLDDSTGYFGAAGLDVTLGDLRVFFEWRYQSLEAEVDKTGGGYVRGQDLDFSGNGFTLGVTYFF